MVFFLKLLPVVMFVYFIQMNNAVYAESTAKLTSLDVTLTNVFFESESGRDYSLNKAIQYNGKSYLPLREMLTIANKKVDWDESTNTIHIKDTDRNVFYSFNKRNVPAFIQELQFETNISSGGGLVLHANSNQIMFEKAGDKRFYPASTVKVMTALLALEHSNLDEVVTVSDTIESLPQDSRIAYLEPGDKLTMKQLLHALLIYSGNDSAIAIAEHVGGSVEGFVNMMNNKAKEIGAHQTNFVNPHGYHDPHQFMTLSDLAKITKVALTYEEFLEIIEKRGYKASFYNKDNQKITRIWETTNQFKKNPNVNLSGLVGSKTGYTDASGYNLVTVTKYNDQTFISVIFKGEHWSRYEDTKKLMTKAFHVWDKYFQKNSNEKSIEVSNHIKGIFVNNQSVATDDLAYFTFENTTYMEERLLYEILTQMENKTPSHKKMIGDKEGVKDKLYMYFVRQTLNVNNNYSKIYVTSRFTPIKMKKIVVNIIDDGLM